MQPVRMSARLFSGTRLLSHPRTNRPAVCRHQIRLLTRSTRLFQRQAASQKEPRELASEDGLAETEEVPDWEDEIQNLINNTYATLTKEDDVLSSLRRPSKRLVDIRTLNLSVDGNPSATSRSSWNPAYLRDCCSCPRCKDPSSTQRTFQTADIPKNIKANLVETSENGTINITWENDIPGFGLDHTSTFTPEFFHNHWNQRIHFHTIFSPPEPRTWNKRRIAKELESIQYEDYMKDDEVLHRALLFLNTHGLLLLRGVPESETAVEDIAGRIGTIRDTFYGRTWDVRSVPEAKNVAYTQQYLGLHMDLLYMANPPGLQLLHCLKNTCEGGSSLFSDSFASVAQLETRDFNTLSLHPLAYEYKNAGQNYYFKHRVIELGDYQIDTPSGTRSKVNHVNYSPPFQGDLPYGQLYQPEIHQFLGSLRRFAKLVEAPWHLFEYKMAEGDCVIFNNRRVLHGRRAFDAQGGGQRWLKGTYVDTDVFMSRWRVLEEKFVGNTKKVIDRLDGKLEKKPPKPINYGPPPWKLKKDVKLEAGSQAEVVAESHDEAAPLV